MAEFVFTSAAPPTGRVSQLVVVDQSVEDWRTLVAGLAADAKLVVLDSESDGLQAIGDAAHSLRDLSGIHIVAHGRPGEVRLGRAVLSNESLDRHAEALARIGCTLRTGGDILLYGCDVARGAAGQSFIEKLAQITSADVAAATHPVGASARGGSFDLDRRIGAITAATPFASRSLAAFSGLLGDGDGGGALHGQAGSGGAGGTGFTGQAGGDGTTIGFSGGGGGGGSGTATGGTGGHGGGGSGGAGAAGGSGAGQGGGTGASAVPGSGGGGGGGGGAAGNGSSGTISANSTGGAGGSGGNGGGGTNGGGGGGGGGAGGYGAIIANSLNNTFTLLGGNGGNGGAGGNAVGVPGNGVVGGDGGNGGAGGVGLQVNGSNFTVANSGSITGGHGGTGGAGGTAAGGTNNGPGNAGAVGSGGVGLVGANLHVVNSGTISGGLAGDNTTRANAINFTGGTNSITFNHGGTSGLAGDISVTGSLDLLQNNGVDTTVASVITGAGSISKSGDAKITLSVANSYAGGTTLNGGTLAIGNAGALGSANGVTLAGGTLQAGAAMTLGYIFALTGNSTIDANGFNVTIDDTFEFVGQVAIQHSGRITGSGTLNLANSSATAANVTLSSTANAFGTLGSVSLGTGNLTLVDTVGLSLTGAVTAGTLGLSISTGGLTQAAGAITAGTLQSVGGVTGGVSLLSAANNIAAIGKFAVTSGDFVLVDTGNTGTLTVNGPLSAVTNVTLSAGGNLTVAAGTVSATNITLTAGSTLTIADGTVLSGAVVLNAPGTTHVNGSVSGMTSLTTDAAGTTDFGQSASVSTTGAQSYNDAVTLGDQTATFTSTSSGDITFAKTVDNGSLRVNSAGTTTFDGAIGLGTGTIGAVRTDAAGSTVLNGGVVETVFEQIYNDPVTLGANTTLTSTNAIGISFASTLNGAFSLAVNTSNSTTFGGAVGGTNPLTSVTTDAGGTTALNGGSVKTSGAQSYHDAVTLGAATTLTSTGGGAITFDSTLDNNGHDLHVNTAGTGTFSGIISDTGKFFQDGSGTTTLSAVNTYSGATTVNAGTLLIGATGSIASSATTVNIGGTLGGSGATGAVTVASGGTLAPGASAGLLTTGNMSLSSGAHFEAELGGTTAGSGYDQVHVKGTVSLGGATLDTSLINGFVPTFGSFEIIDNDGADAVTGTFAGLAEGAQFTLGGKQFTISYHGGDGNDVVLNLGSGVSGVTSTKANGAYKVGDVIPIQVTFSGAVTVDTTGGTPQLTLETGAVDRAIDYSSGTGTSTLTFTYTVQAGDTSADLDYLSTTALALNGGTIRDGGGFDATLPLPSPGAANSLGANKAIVIDTTAPKTTVATASFSADTGASSSDFITKTAAQTISGTTSANIATGEIVEVSLDNGATWSTATTTVGLNTWSLSTTLAADNTLQVRVSDLAGNSSPALSQAYVLDTTAPATPAAPGLTNDTGTLGDKLTSDPAITYPTPAPGDALLYKLDSGSFSTTAPTFATNGSADGPHTVTIEERDTAGNVSGTSSLTFTLDTVAPATPAAPTLASDTGTPGDKVTSDPTISYPTPAAGGVLLYKLDAGSFSTTAPTFATNGSADGPHTVTIEERDTAGNVSGTSNLTFTLDTTAPATPAAPVLANDTGTAGDGLTSDPAITYPAPASGDVLLYKLDAGSYGLTAPTLATNGTADGPHTVSIEERDTAGNVSAASSLTFTLDTVAPVAKDDGFSTTEAAAIGSGFNLFNDNGHGPDTDPGSASFTVATVNGVAASDGSTITLPSGAKVTVHADGTFAYDPNHAFDLLPAAGSGATNLTATDTFTYADNDGLLTGNAATMTVTLSGVDSNDLLRGSLAAGTTLTGGIGNDTYVVHHTATAINDVSGTLDIVYAEGLSYSLQASATGIEAMIVENGTGLTGTGYSAAPNALYSLDTAGQSITLTGGSAADYLSGGLGTDHLVGGDGNDLYVVHSTATTISDTSGTTDIAYVEGVDYSLADGDGVDYLVLENGTGHTATGHTSLGTTLYSLDTAGQSNTLIGGTGDDVLFGGLGADHLVGGDGNDTYAVTSAATTISDTGGATDVLYAESTDLVLADGDGIEILIVDGTGHAATGHATQSTSIYSIGIGNTLAGGSAQDILTAGTHGDTLIGNGGNDFLIGGAGNDTFQFGADFGQDVVYNFQPHGGGANGDTIRMTNEAPGTTFASMVANNQIYEAPDPSQASGVDVIVAHDPNSYVVILNHHLADLTPADFLFA